MCVVLCASLAHTLPFSGETHSLPSLSLAKKKKDERGIFFLLLCSAFWFRHRLFFHIVHNAAVAKETRIYNQKYPHALGRTSVPSIRIDVFFLPLSLSLFHVSSTCSVVQLLALLHPFTVYVLQIFHSFKSETDAHS